MAITAAILCLFFAAMNDLLFRAFARKPRSRGLFVSMVGMIWFGISLAGINLHPQWGPTLFWGCISGFFSAAGNLLLLESMTGLEAGVGSTLYRLNLVPAVLGAALLLGEKISLQQWLGIVLALGAVLAFFPWEEKREPADRSRAGWKIAFAMGVTASLMRAAMGLSYRYGFLHGADRTMVVAIDALFWIFGGILYARLREKSLVRPEKKVIGYSLLSGVFVTGIVVTMALSLQYGQASVVLPIAQMSFLLTAILGVFFLREKLGMRKLLALAAGTAAILLLSI